MGRRRREPAKPPAVTKAEARQEKEEVKVDKQIAAREEARKRTKRGRVSLISGDEEGITTKLGGSY
tara:strand:+ start:2851 stop:3048 length:198 start_codon:yes stop_codon:yes gene_type:complete